MCGICGVVQIGGEPRAVVAPETLDRMTDAMTHRGPNDRGIHVDDGVAFGARRLSIVDVEGGHQPFANETGRIWGMQNGELYNHAEIRADLARARLGIKPLYYAVRDDRLVFGSELKCLLASGLVEPELDFEAIDAF